MNATMSLRESNKEQNRTRILGAARELMREGGLEALSMRDLAVRAQVSSRTPYNLFGSKTDVLMGLLDEPLQRLWDHLPQHSGKSQLLMALTMVGKVYALYEPDIGYYREIYWGLMSSGHHEVRAVALDRARLLALPMIQQAIRSGELKKDTDAEALASQLVLTTAGLLGLWGANLIDGRELVDHIRRGMGLCFLAHCSDTLSRKLRKLSSIR
jgi:AcrR family transcriptional regulator